MEHITTAAVERIQNGLASADEVCAIGEHVSGCAQCAELLDARLPVTAAAASLKAAFTATDEEEAPSVVERPRRAAAIAAAAMLAILASVYVAMNPPKPRIAPRTATAPATSTATPPAVPQPPATSEVPQPALRPEWQALLAAVTTSGRLPFPADLRELAAADALRGVDESPARADAVWPAATAVEDVRPELTWTAAAGAESLVVLRLAEDGQVIEESGPLTVAAWRPRSALHRDAGYTWQVRITSGGETRIAPAPPAPPAVFRVISAAEHEELERARRERPHDALLLGILYARAGMVREARRELEASKDPLAKRLLSQLPPAQEASPSITNAAQ